MHFRSPCEANVTETSMRIKKGVPQLADVAVVEVRVCGISNLLPTKLACAVSEVYHQRIRDSNLAGPHPMSSEAAARAEGNGQRQVVQTQ